jgi:hypothetical protein
LIKVKWLYLILVKRLYLKRIVSCKRSPGKLVSDINNFKQHVARFLQNDAEIPGLVSAARRHLTSIGRKSTSFVDRPRHHPAGLERSHTRLGIARERVFSREGTASVKVNTFHFLWALSYIGLILAGVSTGDHGKYR